MLDQVLMSVGSFLFEYLEGGVHTGSTRHCGHNWPIVPVPGDCEDGEVGGLKWFWQGKPKYSEKTCPGAILSTTNPTCQTRARTRAAAVGSQRLTASAMARPSLGSYTDNSIVLSEFLSSYVTRNNTY
jgi:hypothetical protein